MNNDITYYAKHRHSTKAFDSSKKISNEDLNKVKELLRYSASSTNAQPWHFVIASTDEAKAKVAKATEEKYQFNTQAILDASHVVVFASKSQMDEHYLLKVLEQETKDGRFDADPQALKERMHTGRSFFVNMHKYDLKDIQHWMDKQVYLNLGSFLLGVSTLGIDALPIEGIDTKVLDEQLCLREKGYNSLVVVPIGYSDKPNDYNAHIKKSRLEYNEILTDI